MKVKCIDEKSNSFPNQLKMLEKCPKQIFVLGNESILSEFSLAVIGARKCSSLGKHVAEDITKDMAKNNVIVVSGFARGIDTVAHKTCVQNKAKTIAVLGGGHENMYPRENTHLLEEIVENGGAVISEYPPEYPPLPHNFRERNRIIAALSSGVVLIEAKINSGSLITVKHAKTLNKNIFAVPGSLDNELYEGSNLALSEGAFCVRNAKDVLKRYSHIKLCDEKNKIESDFEVEEKFKNVYACLSYIPKSLEEVCVKSDETISDVIAKLTFLEMCGAVKKIDGQYFVKTRK